MLPPKLIQPLDSAADRAGKTLAYDADPEKLVIHILDMRSSLDLGAIDSVSAWFDRNMIGYTLRIHPSPKRKKEIASFTGARIGRRTVITLDDRVLASPTIRGRIDAADLDISFPPDAGIERLRECAFLLSLQRLPGRPVIVAEEVVQ